MQPRRAGPFLVLVLAAFLPGSALAASKNVADLGGGTYALDRKHSSVLAKVEHMGVSLYTSRFDVMDATFSYDPARPEAARVTASVDATSMDVGADYSAEFAERFLAATKFPKITFASTAIHKGEGNAGTMTGDLTIRGVTRPVTFDVTFNGVGRDLLPPFRAIAGFSATAHIKRSDFGSDFLNNGIVGDDVTLIIEAEFDRK
ncbi:MAG TPA: YceI family protein [Caulobacteraceae bacterium]|nr:YceI family protein [Caulobacteraceae bacterium]